MSLLQEYFIDLTSNAWSWDLVGLNLIIITFFLLIFKIKLSWFTKVSFNDEIANKDNPAFGVVVGFSFLSFYLIMSAASTGDDVIPLMNELFLMIGFAISGILFLFISNLFFDKIIFSKFCLKEQIRNRNIAAALVEGSNILSTALILFTYMGWIKGTNYLTLLLVAYGWLVSQILLSSFTLFRIKMYKNKDSNGGLIEAIKNGNVAVALRHSAYKISFALTPLIASSHYPFNIDDAWWYANAIFISSILLSIAISIIFFFVKKIVLHDIDLDDEINNQNNIGIAFIEASLIIGLTIALNGVLH